MLYFRETEMRQLTNFVQNHRMKAMAIYGRRRTGKTALVLDYYNRNKEQQSIIYFQCASYDYTSCLTDFVSTIIAREPSQERLLRTYTNFRDVFSFLVTQAQYRNFLFIIDEFPFLAKKDENVPVEFQWIIDHALDSMKLILLGSNRSFMKKQLTEEQSPLYGRFDEMMEITPFTFSQVYQLFPVFPEAMDVYAQTGGVAQYVMSFLDYPSVQEASEDLLFQRTGRLFPEAPNLLMQEVRDITTYVTVLRVLGKGEKETGKIAKQCGIEQRNIYPYLNKLVAIGIVSHVENPLSEKKESRYRITDPFFRFYYTFIEPNISLISAWGKTSREVILNEQYHEFLGFIYEDVIRDQCFQYAKDSRIPFIPRKIGKWWGNIKSGGEWIESEIDVIAFDQHNLLLGECKYRSKAIGMQELENLKLKGEFVQAKGRKLHYLLASKSGFTNELLTLHDSNVTLIDQL